LYVLLKKETEQAAVIPEVKGIASTGSAKVVGASIAKLGVTRRGQGPDPNGKCAQIEPKKPNKAALPLSFFFFAASLL